MQTAPAYTASRSCSWTVPKAPAERARRTLERIIEKADEVDVTAAAVVAAVQAYSKINAAGQWVDRSEHLDLNELFEKMTQQELEAYAKDGTLPDWFTTTVGATPEER